MKNWFEVDKEGLAAILQRRGVEFAVLELVSNALDTRAKNIKVTILEVREQPRCHIFVEDDDPEGFQDLEHAFTLFAPSRKKGDLAKRGRFNLGEKLVLAICDTAHISSTKGEIHFTKGGRTNYPRRKRKAGSVFFGDLRMTREEMRTSIKALKTIIVPPGVKLVVNCEEVPERLCTASFEATLPTEVADADGNLKRSRAKTLVSVYEPREGETPMLYELGIPVVETGDKYHVDVHQKVPLNMDRDNVQPAFLRELRAHVLNATANLIRPEDATASWVRDAAGHPLASERAVQSVMHARFGGRCVIYDPSDPEANKLATAKGYTVVHGGSLSSDEWANVRKAEALLPAGKVTPSPKPYSPDGEPLVYLDPKDWPTGGALIAEYARELAWKLLDVAALVVLFTDDKHWPHAATYGLGAPLTFNVGCLPRDFFAHGLTEEVDRLLLHEFSHHYESDHLSDEYAEAGFRLGARLKKLALEQPEFFKRFK